MSVVIGISIEMSGAELITHFNERAEVHQKEVAQGVQGGGGRTEPPRSAYQEYYRQQRLVNFFRLLAERFNAADTYRLTNEDLRMLELPHGDAP